MRRLLAAACVAALAGLAGCMAPPGGGGCQRPTPPPSAEALDKMTQDLRRLLALGPDTARAEAEDLVEQAKKAEGDGKKASAPSADPGRLHLLAGFAFERAGAYRDAVAKYRQAERGSFGPAAGLRRGEVQRLQLEEFKQAGKAYDVAASMVVRERGQAKGWLLVRGSQGGFRAESYLASDMGVRLIAVNLEMAALHRLDAMRREKPLYRFIDVVVKLLGANPKFSYALALIVVALVVTVITTPLTNASFKSMRAMQRMQPLLKELQEKHKGDRQALAAEQMRLMKKQKVNPLGGCLPMLIQMPILIAVYYGIRDYRCQFAEASFLWIPNLAHPDMPLLLLYAVSMYISQKLTTLPTADPQQQQMQRMMTLMMPVMFMLLFQGLPSAFILYWLSYNVFFTARQYYMIKRPEPPPPAAEPVEEGAPPPRPSPGGRRRKKRR